MVISLFIFIFTAVNNGGEIITSISLRTGQGRLELSTCRLFVEKHSLGRKRKTHSSLALLLLCGGTHKQASCTQLQIDRPKRNRQIMSNSIHNSQVGA